MGALHEGHLSLISKAKHENDLVVSSIFVNPTQFNDPKDLENYPIDVDNDLKKLESVNCDVVFLPSVSEMYPEGQAKLQMDLKGIDGFLEGEFRPGHFNGVITIVDKLFSLVQPNKAYFGQKDFQQYCIIKEMSRQLHPKIEVVMCETIREKDGLAMSSRNRLLSPAERELAPMIYATMKQAAEKPNKEDIICMIKEIKDNLTAEKYFTIDYVELADKNTLEPMTNWGERKEAQLFVAAFLGNIRLIDNITIYR